MKKTYLLFALISIHFSGFSQVPTISSFSPTSGPIGTLVTISGTNLSSPTAFSIGGVSAVVVSDNGTSLVGMVMPGATTGAVSVTTAGGSAAASGNFNVTHTLHPSTQQGAKIMGGATYGGLQAASVAISADGNTAILGAPDDSNYLGSARIFIRTGSTWSQQGPKLMGTGAINGHPYGAEQGWAVALSADGNTAIVGGALDNKDSGAVWIFIRSGSIWTQQGPKLVGTGAVGAAQQGGAVALSADGNTAIVGGSYDDSVAGAVWVYTRSGTTWTQQGSKLVGTGAYNGLAGAAQGSSVALSADGNTAMVGAPTDSNVRGSVWVYTRTGTTWTQQGSKFAGTGNIGYSGQGGSVSLSADGNTAIVGGSRDNSFDGAAWIFTRSGTIWSQQGLRLLGSLANNNPVGARQGNSVSISADGNVAIVGGNYDNNSQGAIWEYSRSGTIWTQRGAKLVGTGATGRSGQGYSVALSADGNTAIEGGPYDSVGAAWVFVSCTTPSTTYDTISSATLPYRWNGLTFTGPGSQMVDLIASTGCDSLATLMLEVKPDGITEINSQTPIHLYPNPNKGSFTLETYQSIGTDYIITDMLGIVIRQQSIRSDKHLIELPDAAEGVYTLSAKGASPIRFVIVR